MKFFFFSYYDPIPNGTYFIVSWPGFSSAVHVCTRPDKLTLEYSFNYSYYSGDQKKEISCSSVLLNETKIDNGYLYLFSFDWIAFVIDLMLSLINKK